jgi:hypothetical protein
MRNVLVVTEMAMSLMLLVGAALLMQSIMRLQRQALGIRQDHLLAGHFYLPPVPIRGWSAIRARSPWQYSVVPSSRQGTTDAFSPGFTVGIPPTRPCG